MDDYLIGDANNNTFFPLSGNDIIEGGGGYDMLSYSNTNI
jgi:Ca2+-binding RTX toxin-like protein